MSEVSFLPVLIPNPPNEIPLLFAEEKGVLLTILDMSCLTFS